MTLFYRNHDGKKTQWFNECEQASQKQNNNLLSMSERAIQNSRVILQSKFKSIIYAFQTHTQSMAYMCFVQNRWTKTNNKMTKGAQNKGIE